MAKNLALWRAELSQRWQPPALLRVYSDRPMI